LSDPDTLLARQLMLANCLSVGWPTLGIPDLPSSSVAAIVGNATQESQCQSVTGPKDNGSDGVFQWRLDRLTKMEAWCTGHFKAGWQAIEPQAAYFAHECMTDYPALWDDLKTGMKPLATLTANICDIFERPSADGRLLDKRIAYAHAFLDTWRGSPSPPAPAPAPAPAPPDELGVMAQICADIAQFPVSAQKRITAYLISRFSE